MINDALLLLKQFLMHFHLNYFDWVWSLCNTKLLLLPSAIIHKKPDQNIKTQTKIPK